MYKNKSLRYGLFLISFLVLPPLLDKLSVAGRVDSDIRPNYINDLLIAWLFQNGIGAAFAVLLVLLLYKHIAKVQRPIGLTSIGVVVLYCVSVSLGSMQGYGGIFMFILLAIVSGYVFLELNYKHSFYVGLIFLLSLGASYNIKLLLVSLMQ